MAATRGTPRRGWWRWCSGAWAWVCWRRGPPAGSMRPPRSSVPAPSLLGAALSLVAYWARRPPGAHRGRPRMGQRGPPGHAQRVVPTGPRVLSVAVVASATFILISVDAFRRGPTPASSERASGTGGYTVMVESLLPIVHDLGTDEGRREVGLTLPDGVQCRTVPRAAGRRRQLPQPVRADEAPHPGRPRQLPARRPLRVSGARVDGTDAERANPWLLLERRFDDGAIPVIADANSMTYVLHTPVGDDFVIDDNGRPLRLRVVASLRDSILQGELMMAESAFLRSFPAQQGYGLLLVDGAGPDGRSGRVHGGGRARGLRRRCPPDRANGSTNSTAWRTPTSRRSRRSAGWGCCSAPSAWRPCCCATCSSGGASWRCSAPWATDRRTSC